MPPSIRDQVIAGIWGFAEATLFFIVPDVWIGWLARGNVRSGLKACLSALAGALVGGVVIREVSRRTSPDCTRAVMARVPAVSVRMVDDVDAAVATSGIRSMMSGPLRGIPYKLYARASGVQETPLVPFVLWSVPARLVRFVLAAVGFNGAVKVLRRRPWFTDTVERRAVIAFWAIFYGWFVRKMSREQASVVR